MDTMSFSLTWDQGQTRAGDSSCILCLADFSVVNVCPILDSLAPGKLAIITVRVV